MIGVARKLTAIIALFGTATIAAAADDDLYYFVQADRLEYSESPDALIWDLQGAVGDDYHKLWIKAEGGYADSAVEENELQLLYSRAFTPFFDWQAGLRHDLDPDPSLSYLAVGIQGLAPQWFEIDAAVFLSENGDASIRFEAEYDLLLTQRLVLQPRFEAELSFDDVPERALGSGVASTDLDLRLRYELHRKFAPYVGVSWTRLYGETADLAEAAGDDADDVSVVVGIRAWF